MTCRHQKGDPNCSSHPNHPDNPANVRHREHEQTTPDAQNYSIEEVEQVGDHIVLKAKYPNCSRCTYEGNKIMVFLGVSLKDVIKWRRIDPHFREPNSRRSPTEAPGPAARFPGSAEGWQDAISYARSKVKR